MSDPLAQQAAVAFSLAPRSLGSRDVHAAAVTRFSVAAGTACPSVGLGRYRRGDLVPFVFVLPGPADAIPTATLRDPSNDVVGVFAVPMRGNSQTFALPLRPGSTYPLGTFQLTCVYSVGGVSGSQTQTFDLVAGGDSGGPVVAMVCPERPEAAYLIAQLGSGLLVQGRNPRV